MASIKLYPHEEEALAKMEDGCILNGGVGSGKSITALAYYYVTNGGELGGKSFTPLPDWAVPLYIITTARKRDTFEWEKEIGPFMIKNVTIDSWNNIAKYKNVTGAFFIFDEQRVVGKGTWVKSFLKIARGNRWILLSATPGDTWMDYLPVFMANGFYRTRQDFTDEHVLYNPYVKFPQVKKYLNTGKLIRLRNKILIEMDFERHTVRHDFDIWCSYDKNKYRNVMRSMWDPYKDEPINSGAELCYVLRRISNENEERGLEILELLDDHPRAIIFYNFDYELDILLNLGYIEGTVVAQWNGHYHEEIPDSARWVYLVQYTAGAEGWNCIKTDTIIFYSQTYSYKLLEQSKGRIDRLNTPYIDLYYYHFRSHSNIDLGILQALKQKKNFNVGRFTISIGGNMK